MNEDVLKAIQQRANQAADKALLLWEDKRVFTEAHKQGQIDMYELREEQVKRLTEALEYLMEGVGGLPPLTAIAGTLVKHFEKAKQALKQ